MRVKRLFEPRSDLTSNLLCYEYLNFQPEILRIQMSQLLDRMIWRLKTEYPYSEVMHTIAMLSVHRAVNFL